MSEEKHIRFDEFNLPITEDFLRYLGFTGGSNQFGPSCGKTYLKDGLILSCYEHGDGSLSVWSEACRGENLKRQWQIVHLCEKHLIPLTGIDLQKAPPRDSLQYQDCKTLMRYVDYDNQVKWYLLNGNLSHLNGINRKANGWSGTKDERGPLEKELDELLHIFTADDVLTRVPLSGLPMCHVEFVISCYFSNEQKKRDEIYV